MTPVGSLPVTFSLGAMVYSNVFHVYPQVCRALLSWKAAKRLKILPIYYPCPPSGILPHLDSVEAMPPLDDVIAGYPLVFDGHTKNTEGEEFHIELAEDAQPFCVHTPRAVPFAYCDKLKKELDLLHTLGFIASVTIPTEWCAPIVVTLKKGTEKIRLCVDLSHLNKYVKSERYQSTTPAQAVADIAAENAWVFTNLDVLKGYHQCPFNSVSQLLTTFITPFGRFKFLQAPYGISSISEHYNRRMDEAFAGLQGYHRIVDDVGNFDRDETPHPDHVKQFLQHCSERHITLNRNKWEYEDSTCL